MSKCNTRKTNVFPVLSGPLGASQSESRAAALQNDTTQKGCVSTSSPIQTVTVGPGIAPGRLSWACGQGARGLYRRWGLSPRPEDILFRCSILLYRLPTKKQPTKLPSPVKSWQEFSLTFDSPSYTIEKKGPTGHGKEAFPWTLLSPAASPATAPPGFPGDATRLTPVAWP